MNNSIRNFILEIDNERSKIGKTNISFSFSLLRSRESEMLVLIMLHLVAISKMELIILLFSINLTRLFHMNLIILCTCDGYLQNPLI